jgi:O-acetylhomoserine (thiol)-lyase
MPDNQWSFDTLVIHGAQTPADWQGATRAPIYQSAAHRFDTAEQLSDVFAGKQPGHIYERMSNPTNQALEKRLALLEGGVDAIVTASGMAAISDSILAIVKAGDEVVAGGSLFLSSFALLNVTLPRLGVKVRFVEGRDLEAWKAAITPRTKLVYAETISNPQMEVPDIAALAELAHASQAPLIVDNTLASPYLFRPLEHGADVVVHSTTKYLNGHGSALGGAIIDAGRFDWPADKYPDFQLYKERKGKLAYIDKAWREIHVVLGTTQAPLHSYLTLLGIDTLALRMERHLSNAVKVAGFLEEHRRVKSVNFPGLPENPSHATAAAQFAGRGFGALFTFNLESQEACFQFIRRLRLIYNLANLGDCKTLAIHPWSSQYINMPEDARRANGISPGLVRISIGIEAVDDILADLDQALSK